MTLDSIRDPLHPKETGLPALGPSELHYLTGVGRLLLSLQKLEPK